ncbi:unnamed protein product, partial [Amoebophrya sp. A25]
QTTTSTNIFGTITLLNPGDDCWIDCGKKDGPCASCGSRGMCCRKGFAHNGCDGATGGDDYHTCVQAYEPGNSVRVRDSVTLAEKNGLTRDFFYILLALGPGILEELAPPAPAVKDRQGDHWLVRFENYSGRHGQRQTTYYQIPTDLLVTVTEKQKTVSVTVDKVLFYPGREVVTVTNEDDHDFKNHVVKKPQEIQHHISTQETSSSSSVVVKPRLAAVTYVAAYEGQGLNEVVTFRGIPFGQAELFQGPKHPRYDQLG